MVVLCLDTDNFTLKEPVAVSANKWEGEDEEDDVKVRGNVLHDSNL